MSDSGVFSWLWHRGVRPSRKSIGIGLAILMLLMLIPFLVHIFSQNRKPAADGKNIVGEEIYKPQYANGFSILKANGTEGTVLVTKAPWQREAHSQQLLITDKHSEVPQGYYGPVLRGPAQRVVCMSTTHVALLDAIGKADAVVGVSGAKFLCNPKLDPGKVVDVGYDGTIDYEALVSLRPDIVMLYGIDGASPLEPKLKQLGIPYVYIGEYLEEDPLGKAEWIVAVAEIMGAGKHGQEEFAKIPKRYEQVKQLAADVDDRPKVMLNTPYADSWMMASPESYVGRLIKDAGGEYVYHTNITDRSTAIDMEDAYLMTNLADVWINVGSCKSLDDIKRQWPRFAKTHPMATGNVWNCDLRSNPAGGNDYWESGVVHPDLVLLDLIKIFHPEVATTRPFTYYRQLK